MDNVHTKDMNSTIKLNHPYKIIEKKQKRYSEHYQIPAKECLVVPQKDYGDDLACELHWKDASGAEQTRSHVLFRRENLEPVDGIKDYVLHEMWDKCFTPD